MEHTIFEEEVTALEEDLIRSSVDRALWEKEKLCFEKETMGGVFILYYVTK